MVTNSHCGTGRLHGRRIVITGAASGIGLATARLFAQEGALLALFDYSAEPLQAISGELQAEALAMDVSNEQAVREGVAKAAAAMGGIDGVVNAAGISKAMPFESHSIDDWNRIIAVNLTGPFLVCREALPYLRVATAPTIVNVSSGTALLPTLSGFGCYAASKGGLLTFTKALAFELAPHIRVNAVCPGATVTGMLSDEFQKFVASSQSPYPLKRSAAAIEVAQGILYLTSADSSYVTGIALPVDGGRSLH